MNEILKDAKNQLANNKGILKNSPIIQQFVEARKKIDAVAATKNPLVKEYINIHKEAEKNTNSTIGRMTRAMKNIAAQHMIYMTAIEMSTDEEEKQRLKELADKLAKHPAVAAYGKYIEGLRYLSGEIKEVSSEVRTFFKRELAVPLQEKNSKYEIYRLGVDEYIKQETESLDALEAELQKKQLEIQKKYQELDAKERKEGTIHPDLLKVLDEEIVLKKEREEFERTKGTMESSEATSKLRDLVNKEGMNKLKQKSLIRKHGSVERRKLLDDQITLENDIDGIPGKKEKLKNLKTPPEIKDKVDEYQKTIAKMKARELYSKQAMDFFVLRDSFIGDYLKNKVKDKDKDGSKLFGDRQTPATICIGIMLMQGYKVEEIMDPTALLDKKKEIGQEYIKRREENDEKWYVKTMYDGSIAMMDAFKKYVKEHKEELKTEQDLAMHVGTLGVLSMACFDMYQELSNCKFADKGKYYKTVEEYNLLQDKLCAYECGAGLGTPTTVKYDRDDILRLPADTVATELRRQLRTKMLLEEIQKENPDIASVMITIPEQTSVDQQLVTMPEFKEIYGDSVDSKFHNLSKEDVRQLAYLQSMDFIDKYNIRFDRMKHPTKATKGLNNIIYNINKNEKIGCVVSANGKQLIAVDNILGNAKDNSAVFNKMIEEYDKALFKTDFVISSAKKPEELKDLKEAAIAYINAKRAQKGYDSKSVPNDVIDAQMLGKEKGGKSIFTERGRDRYEFALEIVTKVMDVEKRYEKDEMQKQDVEIHEEELDVL